MGRCGQDQNNQTVIPSNNFIRGTTFFAPKGRFPAPLELYRWRNKMSYRFVIRFLSPSNHTVFHHLSTILLVFSDFGESLLQVSKDIFDVLRSDRESDGRGRNALFAQLLLSQLGVGG